MKEMAFLMNEWIYKVVLPKNQATISIKNQLIAWYIPRRLRGSLRMRKAIRLNGINQPVSTILQPNDQLELLFIESDFKVPISNYVIDNAVKVDVLYENNDLLVINKPAGYKTHPNFTGETGTVMNFVAAYLAHKQQVPYMVHRLDLATSGALIVAKNPIVVPILNQMIAAKIIERTYLAWVNGVVRASSGVLSQPIGHDPADQRKRKVNGVDAQPAITYWYQVQQTYQKTLLRLQLATGRTHQLRVHLQNWGHSIIGDPLYETTLSYQRMLLHSVTVKLYIPFSNNLQFVSAPLPHDFPINISVKLE